jgi:hypothetical protein
MLNDQTREFEKEGGALGAVLKRFENPDETDCLRKAGSTLSEIE